MTDSVKDHPKLERGAATDGTIANTRHEGSVSTRLTRRLRQYDLHQMPLFATMAREFCMAPATLRRRLRTEGASYQAIKDRVRLEIAIACLKDSRRSVLDIAIELGFSEGSAFTRAFKHWTSLSPGKYRRAAQ